MRRLVVMTVAQCVCATWGGSALAQNRLDQADPTTTAKALPDPQAKPSQPAVVPTLGEIEDQAPAPKAIIDRVATAILVVGSDRLPASAFSTAVLPYVGRSLSQADLSNLAGAVAEVAHRRGYPFATATIAPQTMAQGILRIAIDEGKIDAVRVIGAQNARADLILTRALATGRSTTRRDLERAIQLVEDVPGVSVKESRFIRQNGFAILLVTIESDRASGYVQLDNRGTKEVGPIRATMIGNVRGIFQPGDELGLIASTTPLQTSEFAFARARYSSIVDRFGSVLSLTTSYGRVRPGAALSQLDVIGHSLDIGVSYAHPLLRSRRQSLWANLEFRALTVDQSLLGYDLRDDRIGTITASANGFMALAGGTLRGEIGVATGLPLAGATREGDRRSSRPDGDARFVTLGYSFEWSRQLNRWLGVTAASSGQLASRPLLASVEIGAGGPSFARAYDSAERTGDQGVLGALELRADVRSLVPKPVTRAQLYGFMDGGYVDNMRQGVGGGSLLSAGAGLRFGLGRLDGGLEVAFPLNADRYDTGNRRPRFSVRIARSF